MARRKISKKTQKEVVKAAKKYPVITLVIVILLIISLVGCCVLHYKRVITIPFLEGVIPQEELAGSGNGNGNGNGGTGGGDVITDDLQIHFLFLGNKSPGDCTLIKTGNTEILIDAGSTESSAETLVPYIQQYCTDGVLEYVIATHADTDHIAAFVGTTTADGIFESFVCETIIDFPITEKTTDTYYSYVELRDAEIQAGATHYTALECWNNQNGAQRSYTLAEDITMNFLYQKYYEEDASKENNYSVCMLLSQGNNHYLFTGDLEADGEESLLEFNPDLPQCKLYKAGHHGSNTSSTKDLMDKIQPQIVVANCCCGGKYNFPHQEFIDNVASHTDKIYIPVAIADNGDGYELLNGNIVVSSNGGDVTVNCSNNNTIFKDTQWFADNRTWPLNGVTSSE